MDQPKTDSPVFQKPGLDALLPSESTQRAACHYQQTSKAGDYATRISGTGTDRREKKCILEAVEIAKIPAGSSVLDCPCGPGRLIPILKKCGFKVTAADISASMVDLARLYAGPEGQNCLDEKDNLCVANLFDTGFKPGQFDAVVCHRVFQYFSQPQERLLALTELRRISKGPVILSFLCNWSVDALWYKILRVFRLTRLRKCKPISPFTFAKDIRAAGFKIKSWLAMRPFISKRWYVVLEPVPVTGAGFHSSISAYKRIILAAGKRIAACLLIVLLLLLAYNLIAK
jgi:ubiquinone/menaquinone biosynthesis C-methylase UbiE